MCIVSSSGAAAPFVLVNLGTSQEQFSYWALSTLRKLSLKFWLVGQCVQTSQQFVHFRLSAFYLYLKHASTLKG